LSENSVKSVAGLFFNSLHNLLLVTGTPCANIKTP
jgi:hypothetical protein